MAKESSTEIVDALSPSDQDILHGYARREPGTPAKFVVRNTTKRVGHYMNGSDCIEVASGSFEILEFKPSSVSVEIQVQEI